MKTPQYRLLAIGIFCCWFVLAPRLVRCDGIPEPSLFLYGTVRSLENNALQTEGEIAWLITQVTSGRTVTLTTTLSNYSGFSYILEIPCESVLGGTASSNVLSLLSTAAEFDRSQILYGDQPAFLVDALQTNLWIASQDRGRIERVDLLVNQRCTDIDQNSLCDEWELKYFGYLNVDPNDDYDGDGLTNGQESRTGSNPTNAASALQFLGTAPLIDGGMWMSWESAAGRHYSLLRSTNVLDLLSQVGTGGFSLVASNLVATPPENVFVDPTAEPPATYFYRLELE